MKRTAKIDENGQINIEQFADLIDISLVEYYSFDTSHPGFLKVVFYDKDKNVIKPNKVVDSE